MGKKARDIAILSAVEGAILLGGWLVSRARAAPPAAPLMATVVGRVSDQQTNFSIPNAKLTVDTMLVPVDEEGNFVIEELPLGTYTVKASAPGYRLATLEWKVEAAERYVFDVELVPVETLW